MDSIAYYNGKIDAPNKLSVGFNDRVCYFGDGVYDATYSIAGRPCVLEAHLDRFYKSLKLAEITPPIDKLRLKELILELLAKTDGGDNFIYWQITRGGNCPREHVYEEQEGNLYVLIRPKVQMAQTEKISVITVEDTRHLHCNIKTLNLLPNVLACTRAARQGAAEAVFCREGLITECSHSNVLIIKDGIVRTHPTDKHILAGVTRAHVLRICHNFGIPTMELPFTVDALLEADEVFITSAGALAVGVDKIDGKAVGGKAPSLLELIQEKLRDLYRGV